MAISLNGTTGITTPGITNTGAETVVDLTTTGNTILGDASGDTLTVTGGTTTFTQGTANGVAFLNGSKVLTTGSANLTFNGTTLTANTIGAFTLGGTIAGGGNQINNVIIGTTTPLAGAFTTLSATLAGGGSPLSISSGSFCGFSITGAGSDQFIAFNDGATARAVMGVDFSNANAFVINSGGASFGTQFVLNTSGNLSLGGTLGVTGTLSGGTSGTAYSFSGSAPAGSLTLDSSGNLGIGTSSPSSFDPFANNLVVGTGSGSEGITIYAGSANSSSLSFADGTGPASYQGFIQYGHSADSLGFYVNYSGNPSARMTIDSSGNLGLGVAPSAWRTAGSEKVFQIDTGSLYCNSSNDVYLNNNWFLNSNTQLIYLESDYATSYSQQNGQHVWLNAASGTAGDVFSFTQAMTLNSSGSLGIGTTSPAAKLTVINTGDANKQIVFSDSATYYGSVGHNSGTGLNEYRTEASGGHGFFIGTSGTANLTLDSSGNLGLGTTSPSTYGKLAVNSTAAGGANVAITKENSGTANQNGQVLYFNNSHAAATGRNANVVAGQIIWQFSQPTSGALQYASEIAVLSDSQGGASSASSLNLYSSGGLGLTINSAGNTVIAGAMSATGDITSTTGNVVIGTAGKGIDFSATSSGSGTMTSELLADYEEGTWNPSVAGSTTAGTVAYSYRNGYYTKIGRLVYVWFDLEVSSFSGGAGGLTITSFPFSAANLTNFYATFQPWAVASAYASTYTTPTGIIDPNGSIMNMYSTDDGHANHAVMNVNQTGRISGYVVIQTA